MTAEGHDHALRKGGEQMEGPGGHSEAILDCAYDFHGSRLATCAADHRVVVWDQGADGQWARQCSRLEKHSSAVFKLDWAHPEYGQVLASCSADRTVVVWEETQNRYGRCAGAQLAHPLGQAPSSRPPSRVSAGARRDILLTPRPARHAPGVESGGGSHGRSFRTAAALWSMCNLRPALKG
jgi:hypothetical protein